MPAGLSGLQLYPECSKSLLDACSQLWLRPRMRRWNRDRGAEPATKATWTVPAGIQLQHEYICYSKEMPEQPHHGLSCMHDLSSSCISFATSTVHRILERLQNLNRRNCSLLDITILMMYPNNAISASLLALFSGELPCLPNRYVLF